MDEFDQKMEISEQPQEEIVEKIPGRDVYETVSSLVSALLVVVLVFTFLVRLMGVSGPSMIPTLQDGDRASRRQLAALRRLSGRRYRHRAQGDL